MSIRKLADDSAREILASLGGNIDKSGDVAQIVEKAGAIATTPVVLG